jgi:hypothetical protein
MKESVEDVCGNSHAHGQYEDNSAVAKREKEPNTQRFFSVVHQLSGSVVDGRNMVGIYRMAQTEYVGQGTQCEEKVILPGNGQEYRPDRNIKGGQAANSYFSPVIPHFPITPTINMSS